MNRIGVIASSGGAVFEHVIEILKESGHRDLFSFSVVTDRECGIEKYCRSQNIAQTRIIESDNTLFSLAAKDILMDCDYVILFYLRLITKEFFEKIDTYNVHPSILPMYKGFSPLKKAQRDGIKLIGATIHKVDESIDGGPIFAQTACPILNYSWLEEISFYQKIYLVLVLIATESERILGSKGVLTSTANSYPSLSNTSMLSAFAKMKERSKAQFHV